jgi:hypothetical protein
MRRTNGMSSITRCASCVQQRQLIGGQRRDRASLAHQRLFPQPAPYDLDRLCQTRHLRTKQRPFAIEPHFERAATIVRVARRVATAKRDRSILGHPPSPAASRKIAGDAVEIKQIGLPFWSLEATTLLGLWIGFKWRLRAERSTGNRCIQHHPARIQTCPQRDRIWPRLPQQGLQRHRLMQAFDRGVISGTTHPREADFQAQAEQPQRQTGRKRCGRGGVTKERAAIKSEPAR